MLRIALTASAADELAHDPMICRWQEGKTEGRVPLLRYYQRCYSKLNDGTIIEHGDGFSLSLIKPSDVLETDQIVFENVAFPSGGNIIVGGNRSVLGGDFSIGWSNSQFTLEPRSSLLS